MSEYIRRLEIVAKYESEDADLPDSVGIGDHDQVNVIQGLHLLYGAIGSVLETFLSAAADVKTRHLHHSASEKLSEPYKTDAAKFLAEQFVSMLNHLETQTGKLEELDIDKWLEEEESQ